MFGLGGKRKPVVLHIDDEVEILDLVRAALVTLEVEVLSASSAAAGLQLARKRRPDLVLLDVIMPGTDGFEACRTLRLEHGPLPILMLTALAQLKDVEKALAQGADGYLVKPIDIPKLRRKVAEHLGLSV